MIQEFLRRQYPIGFVVWMVNEELQVSVSTWRFSHFIVYSHICAREVQLFVNISTWGGIERATETYLKQPMCGSRYAGSVNKMTADRRYFVVLIKKLLPKDRKCWCCMILFKQRGWGLASMRRSFRLIRLYAFIGWVVTRFFVTNPSTSLRHVGVKDAGLLVGTW